MKRTVVIVAAILLSLLCIAHSMAQVRYFDLSQSGQYIGVSQISYEKCTDFVEGKTLIKLTKGQASDSKKAYIYWNGVATDGKLAGIENTYAVIDYYYKTTANTIVGQNPTFQVDKFKIQTSEGLTNAPSDVDVSGFISGQERFVANTWAPMLVPFTNSKLNGFREKNIAGLGYHQIRMYPSYNTLMDETDELYIGDIRFYTEKPSNVVYSPDVAFENGLLTGSASLYQFKDAQKGCVMMLATYDKNGAMIGCKYEIVTAQSLNQNAFNNISISMNYEPTIDQTAKLFIWQSISCASPLCEAVGAAYTAPITYGTDNELSYDSFMMPGAVVQN